MGRLDIDWHEPVKRALSGTGLLVVCVAASACRPSVLRDDQYRFRAAILELEQDQILDNLVRAYLRLPMIQVDYESVGGTVTDTAKATFGGSESTTDTDEFPVFSSGKLFRLAHLTAQTLLGFTYGGEGTRQSQLTVTAKPVLDKPNVYRAYLEFLTFSDPEIQCPSLVGAGTACPTLVELLHVPAPGLCHLVQKRDGRYYCVPTEHSMRFFDLALKTTVMRTSLEEAPAFFLRNVVKAEPEHVGGGPIDQRYIRLTFDKPLPNDLGSLRAVLQGSTYDLQVMRSPSAPPDSDTTTLLVVYRQNTRGVNVAPETLAAQLTGNDVKVTLDGHRPPIPDSERLLKALGDVTREVQGERLELLRQGAH
jgi:hypothetical protein